jgi:hypothetical protein
VVLMGLTSKNFSASMVRLEVTILASSATRAGAVSLGWTAKQPRRRCRRRWSGSGCRP